MQWSQRANSGNGLTLPDTLTKVCMLRDGLHGLRSDAAKILRAVCLGALHGPLTKSVATRSYFSNQMPRTFASKPGYSVRYWKAKELRPVPIDVLNIIKVRVARLKLDTFLNVREDPMCPLAIRG